MRQVLLFVILGLLLISGYAIDIVAGANSDNDNNETVDVSIAVSELLENPIYNTKISIYGKVSMLGLVNCLCFKLTSGGESLWVDYSISDNKGTQICTANLKGINNGDWVIVKGELQSTNRQISRYAISSCDIRNVGALREPPLLYSIAGAICR